MVVEIILYIVDILNYEHQLSCIYKPILNISRNNMTKLLKLERLKGLNACKTSVAASE